MSNLGRFIRKVTDEVVCAEFSTSWSRRTCTGTSSRKKHPCSHSNAAKCYSRLNSDAAAALVGSLGLIPSINKGDSFVMGEPYVHPASRHTTNPLIIDDVLQCSRLSSRHRRPKQGEPHRRYPQRSAHAPPPGLPQQRR